MNRFSYILAALLLTPLMLACNSGKHFYVNSGVVWTTAYHIKYSATVDLHDSIKKVMKCVDESVSPYNEKSRIASINNNSSDDLDAYFIKLYNKALEVNSASDGLYDPTVMPLVNAWGFGYKNGSLPTSEQLDSILQFVGMSHTSIKGNKLVKDDKRVQFDFSSIAKGMACDEIASMLKRNNVSDFMIEIGGEVVAQGKNQNGDPWRVSIDKPEPDSDDEVEHNSAVVIELDGMAVATSGSYRKYKESGGKKLSHIVNPKTGSSETSRLLSVSVVAPDCMTADAWATACMAMGEEKTIAMMKDNTTLGVMTISVNDDGDYVLWSNKKFADLIE